LARWPPRSKVQSARSGMGQFPGGRSGRGRAWRAPGARTCARPGRRAARGTRRRAKTRVQQR
jgi:hypothetical protein